MVVLGSQFTNSLHILMLDELVNARSLQTGAPCSTTVSTSSRRARTLSNLPPFSTSSPLDNQQDEGFIKQAALKSLQDPRLARPYLSLGFFICSNERTSNAFAVHCEHAVDGTHLDVEHNSGERVNPPVAMPVRSMAHASRARGRRFSYPFPRER